MAVYTHVDAAQIKAFLQEHHLGDYVAHKGIMQGVENTNYLLETTGGKFILTLIEKRTQPKDLPFIFGYMKHLYAAGLPVPKDLIQGQIAGKPAILISFLSGAEVHEDATTQAHCAEVGTALARMHVAAETYEGARDNPVGPAEWQRLFDAVRPHMDKDIAEKIESALAACACDDWQNLPRGAVHADLFRDNVFFDKDGHLSGIFDFYFACISAYAYDLAITVNAWCFHADNSLMQDRLKALLSAYEAVRPLSAEEQAAFPGLRHAAALRIFMTRMYDWVFTPDGAQVVKKDPMEYFAKLNADFKWP